MPLIEKKTIVTVFTSELGTKLCRDLEVSDLDSQLKPEYIQDKYPCIYSKIEDLTRDDLADMELYLFEVDVIEIVD